MDENNFLRSSFTRMSIHILRTVPGIKQFSNIFTITMWVFPAWINPMR